VLFWSLYLPFFFEEIQSHLLGFSTVANNREGFFDLFYFHIYLIYSQINLAKSYYGWSLLGLYHTIVVGWGPNTEGWVTPAFSGKFHKVLIFFPKCKKRVFLWTFHCQILILFFGKIDRFYIRVSTGSKYIFKWLNFIFFHILFIAYILAFV